VKLIKVHRNSCDIVMAVCELINVMFIAGKLRIRN